ncbi:MAG: DUF1874 domain-containing protein [Candidatus Wallbacteria bacterium]|nr:DUF1874 domain-containing protein [Candidatus Wallbacteria bacterium]
MTAQASGNAGRKLLLNAFSFNMLERFPASLRAREATLAEAREIAPMLTSAVGHTETAAIFSTLLEVPVAVSRESVELMHGEEVLIGQYRGPRLPEGSTRLPEGATIQWLIVQVE